MLGPVQILPIPGLPEIPPGDCLTGVVRGQATGLAIGAVRGIDPSFFGIGAAVAGIVLDPREAVFR